MYNIPVLIESTANQVNQHGGYTGMTPEKCAEWIYTLAAEEGIPKDMLILGGDHLGPLTFRDRPEKKAMELAKELVECYVRAGYTKIHLDTSMLLADDNPAEKLSDETIARRAALLCAVSENSFAERRLSFPDSPAPVYVIGSEVPVPGGVQEKMDELEPTSPEEFVCTLETFEKAFRAEGLEDAWARVIAVVVQPGVEFSNSCVIEYDRKKAEKLIAVAKEVPSLILEGHSTDYQSSVKLREMVDDKIAILKVGPALTFGLREALFAMECIERELVFPEPSSFRRVMEEVMIADDKYWSAYYSGTEHDVRFDFAYGLSDRWRYYSAYPKLQKAMDKLFKNMASVSIPIALLYQYFPIQARRVVEHKLENNAVDIVIDHVGDWIDDYLQAVM